MFLMITGIREKSHLGKNKEYIGGKCALVCGFCFGRKDRRVTPSHALMLGSQYSKENRVRRTVGRDASQPITLYIDKALSVEISCHFSRALVLLIMYLCSVA
jgi:hypothetical protein